MQQIAIKRNTRTGSRFSGLMQRKELSDFFPYEALIEMMINAFELLENPKIHWREGNNPRIESSYDDTGVSHTPVIVRKADRTRRSNGRPGN